MITWKRSINSQSITQNPADNEFLQRKQKAGAGHHRISGRTISSSTLAAISTEISKEVISTGGAGPRPTASQETRKVEEAERKKHGLL